MLDCGTNTNQNGGTSVTQGRGKDAQGDPGRIVKYKMYMVHKM